MTGSSEVTRAAELNEHIQDLVDRTAASRHVHSVILGVEADDGATSIRTAAGVAGSTDTYFIASITKMFTAAIVMQLIDEQRLGLHDRVVDLLPELDLAGVHHHDGTDYTGDLEVHHLLHQTSGLGDYFAGGLEEDLKHNRDRVYTVADIVDIARTTGANFRPGDRDGTRSAYSDTNYQLLTEIIESVSGITYAAAVDERIAQRLDLADTYLAGDEPRSPGRPRLTLHHNDQALDLPGALASERGAGGLVSTLDDQLRFSAAYHQGRLFDAGHTYEMCQWNRIFFPIDYGYGLMRYRLPRWMTPFRAVPELIGHSGTTSSFAFYAPDLGCHIAGTLNQLDNPSRVFKLITKVAILIRRRSAAGT